MSELFTQRERWFIRTLFALPVACLIAALFMAFAHAQDWAARHNTGASWEHLAFAIMIELPALFGLILMTLWSKIGGGRKPVVPRLLFGAAFALSFYVQQAYVGSGAAMSARFVAGLPSVAAGVFLELVFWVMGLIEETRAKAKQEAIDAANETAARELKQMGLGDIAPPPTLTPPEPAPDMPPRQPAPQGRTPTPTPTAVSPDMTPDTGPRAVAVASRHGGVNGVRTRPDIQQVSADVTPDMSANVSPQRPWHDMPDTDPDMSPDNEAAERVVTLSADPTPDPADTDTRPDSGPDMSPPDTDADVTPTADSQPDTSPDTDAKRMSDPEWLKAAAMRRDGATVKEIAQRLGKSDRTITRWKLPEPDSTRPVNGHAPDLTGANH